MLEQEQELVEFNQNAVSQQDEEEKKQEPSPKKAKFQLLTLEAIENIKLDDRLQDQLNYKFWNLQHQPIYKWEGEELPEFDQSMQKELRIFTVSWNMQGRLPSQQLKYLLRSDTVKHHIIAFASQECQRSIGLSLFCDSKEEWENQISNQLGNQYILIGSNKLNALHLCIFAHISIISLVTEKKLATMPTGFLNIVGNKGGCAISIKIGNKKVLFMNNHLKSGQNVQKDRNKELVRLRTDFPMGQQNTSAPVHHRFDCTFWMGDFNSRIDQNLNQNSINQLTYLDALTKDQFLISKIYQGLHKDFQEGMIQFPPTYKLRDTENKYTEGKDWRVPGWTDRILFYENSGITRFQTIIDKTKNNQIIPDINIMEEDNQQVKPKPSLELMNYDCAYNVLGSDHRAVYAQFILTIQ